MWIEKKILDKIRKLLDDGDQQAKWYYDTVEPLPFMIPCSPRAGRQEKPTYVTLD